MHEQAVSGGLLKLLRTLMTSPDLTTFALGGGTSLALRYGHRRSVDIDLFTESPFDSGVLVEDLHGLDSKIQIVNRTSGSVSAVVGGVKLDILLHTYPRLTANQEFDEIRFISLPDIAAMKINAVTNRGSKKDFSDLLLLEKEAHIGLRQALDFFCAKYGEAGRFLALRSLVWFEDAEEEPDPVYLNGWTWKQVRADMDSRGQKLREEFGV